VRSPTCATQAPQAPQQPSATGTAATSAPAATQALAAANPTVTPTFVAMNPAPAADQVEIEWWNQFSTPTCQTVFPKIINDFQKENPRLW